MEDEDQGNDRLFDNCMDDERTLTEVLSPKRRSRMRGRRPPAEILATGGGPWLTTAALCGSFLGLGMCVAVIGPTFEDLALNVHKNISNISFIFAGRSAGYIGGSMLGGTLLDCLNPHLLLGLSMLLTAVGMCSIPLCRNVWLLMGFMSCIGISMGILDTGGNVLALNTWGEKAGPHLQALHFSFAAGALLSPVIAQLLFGARGNRSSLAENVTVGAAVGQEIYGRSHMRSMWAYEIIGLFVLLSALSFFMLYFCGVGSRGKTYSAPEPPQAAKHHKAIVALLFLFYFAYVGAEVAYGSFIFTFSKDFVGLEEAEAAGINTLFWGSFAACRGLAILLATCVTPGALITLSLLCCCGSSLLLCLFPLQRLVLWAGTGLYGASMAAVFPSGLSWVEQYTPVTGRTAAVLVVGAALGEMVLPVLLGFLMGRVRDEPLLMYQALACAIFCAILFPVMYRLAVASGTRAQGDGEREMSQALLESENFEVFEMDTSHSSDGRSPGNHWEGHMD